MSVFKEQKSPLNRKCIYHYFFSISFFQDIAAKQTSEQDLLKAQTQKQRETQEISQKSDQLTVEKNELEKLKNELNSKQESRDEKLKVLQQKINAKKENSDREREKSDVYGQRIKEFLGLQIVETTTGSTVLIFNNIDKIDTERKYLCEFTLDGPDKRTYKGTFSILSKVAKSQVNFFQFGPILKKRST